MRSIQRAGLYADIVEAPSPTDPSNTVKLGVRSTTFQQYGARGLFTAIAQYYGIVQGDLISAQHAFRGLKRPLALGEDMDADQSVVVYTWRSQVDYEWLGSQFDGNPVAMAPPPGRVFVVLVREEPDSEEGIHGSIERWNWVRQDPRLPHAPVDWSQRYGGKLWSR
jgi:hypothetical protein